MPDNIILSLVAGLAVFILFQIVADLIKRQQNRNNIILKLNRNYYHLIIGLVWFAFFLVWSFSLLTRAQHLYQTLGGTYFNSVYQLVDLDYLQGLRDYFYENSMLHELNDLAFYQNQLQGTIFWVLNSACISTFYLYMGCRHIKIIDQGIFLPGRIIQWGDIINFDWSGEKRLLGKKDNYFDLILALKKSKLIAGLGAANQLKIKVNRDNKDLVNSLLEGHVKKEF